MYTVTDVDGDSPVKSPLVMSPCGLIVTAHLSLYAHKDSTTQHQHCRNSSSLTYITADGKSIQVTIIFQIAAQNFIPAQFCKHPEV